MIPAAGAEEPKQLDPFKDSGEIAAYARKSVATFIKEGIVSGKGGAILDPNVRPPAPKPRRSSTICSCAIRKI